jgi:hypothetical protein
MLTIVKHAMQQPISFLTMISANATQSLTPKMPIPVFYAPMTLHSAMLAPLMEQNQPVHHVNRLIS